MKSDIKNLVKSTIVSKCSVALVNGSIEMAIDSRAKIEYILISNKKYKCDKNKVAIPFDIKVFKAILAGRITFGVRILKKLVRIKPSGLTVEYKGDVTRYKGKNLVTSDAASVEVFDYKCEDNTISFSFEAFATDGILEKPITVLLSNDSGKTVREIECSEQKVEIEAASELIKEGRLKVVFIVDDCCLAVSGIDSEGCVYDAKFTDGSMIIRKTPDNEYTFITEDFLSEIPPFAPKYKSVDKVQFDKMADELIVFPKAKYTSGNIKVFIESMKNGERTYVCEAPLKEEVHIASSLILDKKIDMIERFLLGFETHKGGKLVETNYFKITSAKRRLMEDNILTANGENCISFISQHYLVVLNKENFLLYDRKFDFDVRRESFETDFEICSFDNYKCTLDLKIDSIMTRIYGYVIYATDSYTKSSYCLYEKTLDEIAFNIEDKIELDFCKIKDKFYNNMRLNIRIGVIFKNGYKESGLLKKKKGVYDVEERYLSSYTDESFISSLYLAPNEFNLNLWYTTVEEYEKSIRFQIGREMYTATLANEAVDNNMIFFEANLGKDYTGNPKYLHQYMLGKDEYKNLKVVWAYPSSKECKIPGNPIIVERGSKEYFYYLAKAKYWVNNILFPVKEHRNEVVYLNTWHGTPLKKLGFDIEVEGPEKQAFDNLYRESLNWDYLLVDNDYGEDKLVGAFHFKKNVIKKGYPINDIFYDKEHGEVVKKRIINDYPAIEGKKVVLYAPTWRDLQGDYVNGYDFELPFDIEDLHSKLGEECVIIVKLHHLIADSLVIEDKYKDFIINASGEEDIMELLCVTDILITDYSSVFYDFASARKPILFYMYDLEEYINKTRGLYVGIDTLPGPIIRDSNELTNQIKAVIDNRYSYNDKLQEFCNEMAKYCKGTSCKDVLDIVIRKEDLK